MDLASEPDTSNCEEAPRLKTKKPFPLLQLSIVWLIQFSEPVSNTVIYPFINQFVTETGITRGDETRTGYYAGIIESAFFLAETLSVYHWGRLSDRIGRRPVLLVAPLGLACSILLFGLSHSFWILVASRCAQGVFNGNIGVGKTVMIEVTDPDDVPTAFGWIPAFWSIGITLGPIIGGVLARPAVRWPDVFGRSVFFQEYPYFLPCAVAGSVAFISFVCTYFFMEESMPSILKHNANQKQRKSSMHASDIESTPLLASTIPEYGQPVSAAGEEHVDSAAPKPLPFTALLTRDVLVSSISMASIAFLDQSFGVLLPLMLSTSIPLGGLGFDPYTIGMTMGTWGLLNAGFQVIAFPTLFKWFGPRKLIFGCFSCGLVVFPAFPFLNAFARKAGGADFNVWGLLSVQLFFFSFVFMSYSCAQLYILDAAPPGSIGAVNGLSQILGSIMRTLAPTLTSSLFSLSIQKQLLGGHLVYGFLVSISLLSVTIATLLPPGLRNQSG